MRQSQRGLLLQAMGRPHAKGRWPITRRQGVESISCDLRAPPSSFNRHAGHRMNKALTFQFDEIGYWSELKLEIVEKYGAAYTKAFSIAGKGLKKYYIDAFSGPGVHLSKRTKSQIEGSPARALKVSPPFDAFYFID